MRKKGKIDIEIAKEPHRPDETMKASPSCYELSLYLTAAMKTVETWSKEYVTGYRVFHLSKKLELDDWTKAYNWVKAEKTIESAFIYHEKNLKHLLQVLGDSKVLFKTLENFSEVLKKCTNA